MKNKIIFLTMIVIILTGCSHMHGEFDCPIGKGVSCHSMKTVDQLASQGYFSNNRPVQWKVNIDFKRNKRYPLLQRNTLALQAPHRVPEPVWKVWFAPYVDRADNYHHESEVYVVMDRSFWQGNPVRTR